jgi:hypothetical protein
MCGPADLRVRTRRSGLAMITVPELAADALGKFLANYMRRRFGSSQAHLVEMVPSIARIAIECIGNSDALYHEFEEAGLNRQLGYSSPADLVNLYPQFYWNSVAPHVQTAIRYLNVTSSGRQWIANLYSNVFRAERDISLSGPQK